jgi:hypothetical protein
MIPENKKRHFFLTEEVHIWYSGRCVQSSRELFRSDATVSNIREQWYAGSIQALFIRLIIRIFQLIFLVKTVFSLTTNQPTVFFSRLISTAKRGHSVDLCAIQAPSSGYYVRQISIMDQTKVHTWRFDMWAGLDAKKFAKWHCSSFRCYLANIVQSWSN